MRDAIDPLTLGKPSWIQRLVHRRRRPRGGSRIGATLNLLYARTWSRVRDLRSLIMRDTRLLPRFLLAGACRG